MNKDKRLTKTEDSGTLKDMIGRKNYVSQISGDAVTRQATHFTVRLKQMKYDTHMGAPVALARGKYKGYPFLILNMGTHPCAYVGLPPDHLYYKKHYNKLNESEHVRVHGGFTYSEDYVQKSTIKDRWWIGWDYAHIQLNDYSPMLTEGFMPTEPKRWTREEVITEVKNAIDQLDK